MQRKTSISDLPPEILSDILGCLAKEQPHLATRYLRNACLVCRLWRQTAIPHLFARMKIVPRDRHAAKWPFVLDHKMVKTAVKHITVHRSFDAAFTLDEVNEYFDRMISEREAVQTYFRESGQTDYTWPERETPIRYIERLPRLESVTVELDNRYNNSLKDMGFRCLLIAKVIACLARRQRHLNDSDDNGKETPLGHLRLNEVPANFNPHADANLLATPGDNSHAAMNTPSSLNPFVEATQSLRRLDLRLILPGEETHSFNERPRAPPPDDWYWHALPMLRTAWLSPRLAAQLTTLTLYFAHPWGAFLPGYDYRRHGTDAAGEQKVGDDEDDDAGPTSALPLFPSPMPSLRRLNLGQYTISHRGALDWVLLGCRGLRTLRMEDVRIVSHVLIPGPARTATEVSGEGWRRIRGPMKPAAKELRWPFDDKGEQPGTLWRYDGTWAGVFRRIKEELGELSKFVIYWNTGTSCIYADPERLDRIQQHRVFAKRYIGFWPDDAGETTAWKAGYAYDELDNSTDSEPPRVRRIPGRGHSADAPGGGRGMECEEGELEIEWDEMVFNPHQEHFAEDMRSLRELQEKSEQSRDDIWKDAFGFGDYPLV